MTGHSTAELTIGRELKSQIDWLHQDLDRKVHAEQIRKNSVMIEVLRYMSLRLEIMYTSRIFIKGTNGYKK